MMVDAHVTRLPNGLRVATALMPQAQSVSIGVWVGVGGRHEPAERSGISHFIEHLLFKGTHRRSARQISETIEGRGGDINAYTQEESTCYFARVGADRTWEALDVLLDMYLNPRLASDDIRRERAVVIEEILMGRDQPQQRVEELLGELLWPGHPLGRPLTGSTETVRRLGRKPIVEYLRGCYVPANTVVVFAGPVEHDACVRRVAGYVGSRRAGRRPSARPVRDTVRPGRLGVHTQPVEQTHVALGLRAFGRHDPRRYALKVLSVVLGENMSSRLFQVVREQEGLAYAIQSGAHLFRDSGALTISAGLDRERIDRAMQLIVRELARLRQAPVGGRELGRARDYAIGQIRLGLEGTGPQMTWVGEHLLAYGEIVQPETAIESLRAVTAADVLAVARSVVRPQNASLAVVSPELGQDLSRRLAALLRCLNG